MAQENKFKEVWVKTPDGLTISAQDWGNPTGPEIVFIHGFSQSHLSWIKQVTGELAKDFHMVTYDLRGHGNSDKPLEPERYKDSKAWADELQAVMDATGIKRPVLAGWSYGGRIMADYLTHLRPRQACRPQLRRCRTEGRSRLRRPQPEEPSADGLRRPRR